ILNALESVKNKLIVKAGANIGNFIFQKFCHGEAPSIEAASINSPGILLRNDTYITIMYPLICQVNKITNPQKTVAVVAKLPDSNSQHDISPMIDEVVINMKCK